MALQNAVVAIEKQPISGWPWHRLPALVAFEFFEHGQSVCERLLIIHRRSIKLCGKAPPQGMCLFGQVRFKRLLIFIHGDGQV